MKGGAAARFDPVPPNSMFKHKKATAILLGLALIPSMFYGVNAAYAKHHGPIPGVDIPYDSAAFYSMTQIDWADSAPSRFALKALAGNGGNVIDLTRLLKSILFGDDWLDLTKMHTLQTETYSAMFKPYEKTALENVMKDSDTLLATSQKMGEIVQDMGNVNVFYPEPSVDEVLPDSAYDKTIKLQQQEKTYHAGAQVAKTYLENQDIYDQAEQDALAAVANADSQMQSYQALAHLQNVQAEQNLQTNALVGALLNVYATRHAAEMDQEAREAETAEGATLNVVDPYSERSQKTLKEVYGYEKYVPHGMPDFK